jgi:hypothetical protein
MPEHQNDLNKSSSILADPATAFISSQKIAEKKLEGNLYTYKELSDQPKININYPYRIRFEEEYAKNLKKLERKIEQWEQRNWFLRIIEKVFGNPELTKKKTELLSTIKTQLETEHQSLVDGTKKFSEVMGAKLREHSIQGDNSSLTWRKVVAQSSFSNKKSATKELLDEIAKSDESHVKFSR